LSDTQAVDHPAHLRKELTMNHDEAPADRSADGLSTTRRRDLPLRAPARTIAPQVVRTGPGAVPAAGDILADRYEILRELGRGGMGIVFAAHDRVRDQTIALKFVLPELLGDPAAHERLAAEATLASSLAHPNIVRVYDLHRDGDRTFLTMELLAGRTLRAEIEDRAARKQRFTVEEVRRLAVHLGTALAHAHEAGAVHRDVKPENVWLDEGGAAKLTDFGIARLLRPGRLATTGLALGTAYYMAPEQLKGSRAIDHRADQYALAVVLYELLTGEVPAGAVRPPHERRKSVPVGVSIAVMRALGGDPADRFPDVTRFTAALCERPRTVSLRTILTAAVVAVVLTAVVFRVRSTWRHDAADGRHGPAPSTEAKTKDPAETDAKLAYAGRHEHVEDLKRQAEQIGPAITAEVKDTAQLVDRRESEVQRAGDAKAADRERQARDQLKAAKVDEAVAAAVAEWWKKHPQAGKQIEIGKRAVGIARALYQDGAFAQAVAELDRAEAAYRQLLAWRQNATETARLLQVVREERQTTEQLMRSQPAPADVGSGPLKWLDWVEPRMQQAVARVLDGDGSAGLADLQALDAAVKEVVAAVAGRNRACAAARLAPGVNIPVSYRTAAVSVEYLKLTASFLPLVREGGETIATTWRQADRDLLAGNGGPARSGYRAAEFHLLGLTVQAVGHLPADCPPLRVVTAAAQARPLYEQAATAAAGDAAANLGLAAVLLIEGDAAAAVRACDAALRLDGTLGWAHLARGLAHARQGAHEAALKDFDAAAGRHPRCAVVFLRAGDSHVARAEWTAALDRYERAVASAPNYAPAHAAKAGFHLAKDRLDQAITDYEVAARLEPKNLSHARSAASTRSRRGDNHRAAGNTTAAQDDYDRAVALDAGCVAAYVGRAQIRLQSGDLDGAVTDATAAARLDTGHRKGAALAHVRRGDTRRTMNNLGGADEDYSRAIEFDESCVNAYAGRSAVRKDRGDLEGAVADAAAAARLSPAHNAVAAALYTDRGCQYLGKKEYDQALADFNEAIRLGPAPVKAYLDRGYVHMEKGNLQQAHADCSEAIRLNPKWSETYRVRGNVSERLGNLDAAIADYQGALKIVPTASLFLATADLYVRKGEYEPARRAAGEAIGMDDKNARAYRVRGLAGLQQLGVDPAFPRRKRPLQFGIITDPTLLTGSKLGQGDSLAQLGLADPDANDPLTLLTPRRKRLPPPSLDGAIADFDKAIALDAQDWEAYRARGAAKLAKGANAEALSDLEKARSINPLAGVDEPSKQARVGVLLAKARGETGGSPFLVNGPPDVATLLGRLTALDEALKVDPNHAAARALRSDLAASVANAYADRGRSHAARSDHQAAVTDFGEAIRLSPHEAAYKGRGEAYHNLGNYAAAAADFTAAINRSGISLSRGLDPALYLARARARIALGEYDAAIADCNEAGRMSFVTTVEQDELRNRAKIGALLVKARGPVNPFAPNPPVPDPITAMERMKAADEALKLDPNHAEAKSLRAKLEPLIYDRTPQIKSLRLYYGPPELAPKPIDP
jgi:tetratricopeptide (TPR) repeat protein